MRMARLWIASLFVASIAGFILGRATSRPSSDDTRSPVQQARSDARSPNENGGSSGLLNTVPDAGQSDVIADLPKKVSELTDAAEPGTTETPVPSSTAPMTTHDEHASPAMTS